jgi:hypothetical protein
MMWMRAKEVARANMLGLAKAPAKKVRRFLHSYS